MLLGLTIQNIAAIEQAEISFGTGFQVLSGETGAGKSLIIESLNMVLGERTSREVVKNGANKAAVSALFAVSESTKQALSELGISIADDQILLSRELFSDGRNICKINGSLVTVGMLKQAGNLLVNIHGQQDNQALFQKGMHRSFLDSYAGIECQTVLTAYQAEFEQYSEIKQQLSLLQMDESEKLRNLDLLRFQIEELEATKPWEWNEEELQVRRNRLNHAEKLRELFYQVTELLNDSTEQVTASELVGQAAKALSDAGAVDEQYLTLSERLDDLSYQLSDLSSEVKKESEQIYFDAEELEQLENQLSQLHKLKQKYGADTEAMRAFYEKALCERNQIELGDQEIARLSEEQKQCESRIKIKAEQLSSIRKKAACRLEQAVMRELEELNMPKVTFQASFIKKEWDITGMDEIEFLISTNPSEPPKPMTRIASGGEMARIMLAIKTVLSKEDTVETLIFDEIDTGVSGRAASKIAEKMRYIAEQRQVLCVTHLPQIAAMADEHFLVEKNADTFRIRVMLLNPPERVEELARLMGGNLITDSMRESAKELLEQNKKS